MFWFGSNSVFDPFPVLLIVEFRCPVAVVTVDTNPLIVNLSPDRQRPLVMGVVLVFTPWAVASFTLDAPKLRRDLLTDKSLRAAIACGMTFQTVGVVLHPAESGESVGVGIFLPLLEVFKMAKPAFPVADVIGLFLSAHADSLPLERKDRKGRKNRPQH